MQADIQIQTPRRGARPGASRRPRPGDSDGVTHAHHPGALAIVAHDLKGPLANLSLLVDAIGIENAKAPRPRLTELTARADALVDRLQGVLMGLLDRTRLHGDPLAVVAQDVDLAQLIARAVAGNAPLAAERRVRVVADDTGPLWIRGDAETLLQALDNLVNNAVKHAAPGGIVACEATRIDDGGVAVLVRDDGPGLSDGDLARAFRPFTRLSAVSDATAPGSGLGLWIVRLIAENHGGRIDAANNADRRGATFTLRLPRGRS
ncbi:hypothetical protein GE300_02330 [Rhodobacteraceae bacterium 2CG4]|uniref:histidine kinase n=1 Tax=Halovulum marinum TaxID=2662447 RepID=A0A6L5YVT1_9RHOB|nr:HAMP domain-containing sensor histidine kinase [Halovulum marinum]MSU88453.1 hypothetical protein [Halovulum marinum]